MPPRRVAAVAAPERLAPPATRPKPMKRSASAASLLTPPRTVTRKRRAPGRSANSDSDSDADVRELDDSPGQVPDSSDREPSDSPPRKRRRTGAAAGLDAIARQLTEEDAFWAGASADDVSEPVAAPEPKTTRTTRGRAPVSPPPSTRKGTRSAAPLTPLARPPVTPPRSTRPKRTAKDAQPIRDSPDNPFLDDFVATPVTKGEPDDPEAVAPVATSSSPPPYQEPRTITYVFRGQKREFQNPYYGLDAAADEARAALSPSHPDFEPSHALPRKLLFPAKKTRRVPARSGAQASVSKSVSPPSDDGAALLGAVAGRRRRTAETTPVRKRGPDASPARPPPVLTTP